MKIEILKEVSIKSVREVCEQAGKELAYWGIKNGYPWSYHNALRIETIQDMPPYFHAWLEKHGFIFLFFGD